MVFCFWCWTTSCYSYLYSGGAVQGYAKCARGSFGFIVTLTKGWFSATSVYAGHSDQYEGKDEYEEPHAGRLFVFRVSFGGHSVASGGSASDLMYAVRISYFILLGADIGAENGKHGFLMMTLPPSSKAIRSVDWASHSLSVL